MTWRRWYLNVLISKNSLIPVCFQLWWSFDHFTDCQSLFEVLEVSATRLQTSWRLGKQDNRWRQDIIYWTQGQNCQRPFIRRNTLGISPIDGRTVSVRLCKDGQMSMMCIEVQKERRVKTSIGDLPWTTLTPQNETSNLSGLSFPLEFLANKFGRERKVWIERYCEV